MKQVSQQKIKKIEKKHILGEKINRIDKTFQQETQSENNKIIQKYSSY